MDGGGGGGGSGGDVGGSIDGGGTHITTLDDGRETRVAARTVPAGRILLTPEAAEHALGWVRGAAAPDFTLPDVDGVPHSLGELRSLKVALVFWGSWCGCRYDLPEWERRHAALAEHGFSVLSVAVDRRAADAAPWIAEAAVTHPALIDSEGAVSDLYDVLNVPTVLWIDEEGQVACPHDTQCATDLFRELSGPDSGAALAALDRWVLAGDSGVSAEDAALPTRRATAARQQAGTEAALALWLHRNGRTAAAERHFARAEQLAPEDLTIWRGTMPLQGLDPMGDEYVTQRTALTDAGIPLHRPLGDWQQS